jgi:autotransporter-associated beta strand protein
MTSGRAIVLIAAVMCSVNPEMVLAANGTWTNLAAGSWSTVGNWNAGSIADGADYTADFSTIDITADTTVILDGPRTIGHLVFGDTTPSHKWILGTGTGGPLTLQVASGNCTINVTNQAAVINAALAGSSPVAKAGFGVLTLGGTNTHTGGTVINAGTIDVADINAFGGTASDNGVITINTSGTAITGGAFNLYSATGNSNMKDLIVNGNASFTNNMVILGGTSNVKGLSIGGTGTLTYGGFVTPYNGRMDLMNTVTLVLTNGASISLTGSNGNQILFASSTSTLVLAGGSFSCTGNNGWQASLMGSLIMNAGTASMGGLLSHYINMQAGTVLSLNGGTLSVQGISGQPSVTINFNGGTLAALFSTNTFINPVIVTNKVKAGGAVINTGTNTIGFGVALVHDDALGTSPDGGLIKLGTGTLTLLGTNTYNGATIVSNGVLNVSGDGSIGASMDILVDAGQLVIESPTNVINKKATVRINSGATMYLTNDVMEIVGALYLDGVGQAYGSWGSPLSEARHKDSHFEGAGQLYVKGEQGLVISIR